MKARQYINMMGMAAAVLLSSCVKDTLYDTPHPDYGKIAVTADWSPEVRVSTYLHVDGHHGRLYGYGDFRHPCP